MQTKTTEEISPVVNKEEVKVSKPKPIKALSKPKSKSSQPATKRKEPSKPVSKVSEPKVSNASLIWTSIKDRELGLFGLPEQTVEKYCSPMDLDPTKCMLKYKVSSVIPALESVVSDYDFEVAGPYLVISMKK